MICTLETALQISVEATLNLSVLLWGPSPKQSQDYVSKCENKWSNRLVLWRKLFKADHERQRKWELGKHIP